MAVQNKARTRSPPGDNRGDRGPARERFDVVDIAVNRRENSADLGSDLVLAIIGIDASCLDQPAK
jgi:hypothetical protein